MANPTFNGTSLLTAAARDAAGCPAVRSYREQMPGVDGARLQLHGRGSRRIVVEGVLTATGVTAAEAVAAVKQAIRDRQALADGRTVGPYIGTDGAAYPNCLLVAFESAGEVHAADAAAPLAVVRCRAELTQLVV